MPTTHHFIKYSLATVGGIVAYLKPALPFVLIRIGFILCDCWTAYRLSQRMAVNGESTGKFRLVLNKTAG